MINKASLLAIQSSLEIFFVKNEFIRTKGDVLDNSPYVYQRKLGRSSEAIVCHMEVNDPQTIMSVSFNASKRYEDIEQFLDDQDLSLVAYRPNGSSTVFIAFEPSKQVYKFPDEEVNKSHERIANDLISIVTEKILPLIKRYDDIRVLDAEANTTFTSSVPIAYVFYWYHKLIIAKLAGNPKYEELYKVVLDRFEGAVSKQSDNPTYKNYLTVLKRVAERLKNVSPLANPMMS
jgi:hypothetical protein